MTAALLWLIAALVLVGLEMLTGDFIMLMLGGGALVTAGGALLFPEQLWAQGLIFLISATLLLILVRPALKRRVTVETTPTNADALIGRPARVLEEVSDTAGRVQIGGENWSARPAITGEKYPAGTNLVVTKISGATAIVAPEKEK